MRMTGTIERFGKRSAVAAMGQLEAVAVVESGAVAAVVADMLAAVELDSEVGSR